MNVVDASGQRTASSLDGQRIVVTGAAGQLGTYLVEALGSSGAVVISFGRRDGQANDRVVDITDAQALGHAIDEARPDAIIHAAAMTDVDGCETSPRHAERINHLGTRNVARVAAGAGIHLVAVSTDFVFSGEHPPYTEDAKADPVSVYGATKRAGEVAVMEASDSFAIARTAWVYGGQGKHFPRTILNLLAARQEVAVVEDERGNPTHAGDLAAALVQLVAARIPGIMHLTNAGSTSRFQFAREVASHAGLDPERIQPTTVEAFLRQYPLPARRPADSTLENQRAAALGISLPTWQDALARYIPRLVSELQCRQ